MYTAIDKELYHYSDVPFKKMIQTKATTEAWLTLSRVHLWNICNRPWKEKDQKMIT